MEPNNKEVLRYLIELARALHIYGSSADRLELAVCHAADSFEVKASVFSTPTMLTLVFRFADDEVTRLLRVYPSGVDLHKLTETDKIGDRVRSGELTAQLGFEQLKALELKASIYPSWLNIIAFGLSSMGICAFFRIGVWDLAAAFFAGIGVGLIVKFSKKNSNLWALHESIAGFFVALFAKAAAILTDTALSHETIVLSGLVVLFPGLTMTVALRELATQNLASGVARLAGAFTILMKLVIGIVLATPIISYVSKGLPIGASTDFLPFWLNWALLPLTVLSFTILFRVPLFKAPLVFVVVVMSLLASRLGNFWGGANFGIFFAGCTAGMLSNFFSRIFKRPASVTLVPGVMMLVPGALSYQGLRDFLSTDAVSGLASGVNAIFFATALAAGVLFGNLVVPPRRSL